MPFRSAQPSQRGTILVRYLRPTGWDSPFFSALRRTEELDGGVEREEPRQMAGRSQGLPWRHRYFNGFQACRRATARRRHRILEDGAIESRPDGETGGARPAGIQGISARICYVTSTADNQNRALRMAYNAGRIWTEQIVLQLRAMRRHEDQIRSEPV